MARRARLLVDSECNARPRVPNTYRGRQRGTRIENTRGKKFPFPPGHLTFKCAARSNAPRRRDAGFSRTHNFRLKCEFPRCRCTISGAASVSAGSCELIGEEGRAPKKPRRQEKLGGRCSFEATIFAIGKLKRGVGKKIFSERFEKGD